MAIPFLQHLDLKSSAELRNALLHKTTSGTAVDAEAGIIYDTGSNTVKYYNGSAWISLTTNTNDYVDGASLSGTDLILTRTGSLSDLTVDLSSLDELVNDSTITITAGTYLSNGGSFTTNQALDGTITLNHDSTTRTDTNSTDTPAYGGTFEAVTGVTTNAQGHVTAIDVSTVTIPASDNTDTTYDISVGVGGGNSSTIDLNAGGSGSGTDSITVSGTSLGVKVTESGDTITVGLQDDIQVDGLTVQNDVSIGGNLIVAGTTTTLNETVQIVENNTIAFEGTTADAFEVKLTAQDATVSDKTATLQDKTGTIALTSDISDDTITITAGNALTGGGTFTLNGSDTEVTINHEDTSSQASVDNSGRTYIQDITLDTYGHITGITSATETVVDTNTQLATASALIDVSVMAGNSTASFTHSLGSKNLIVQLYDAASGQIVAAEVDHTSINAISVIFSNTGTQMAANGIGDIRVVVIDAKNGLTDKAVSYS
jgi:hypothetical protein